MYYVLTKKSMKPSAKFALKWGVILPHQTIICMSNIFIYITSEIGYNLFPLSR